jgi:hypothetical protein
MFPTRWRIAGIALLALGLAPHALAYQEKPPENGPETSREAILQRENAALKEELAGVKARLAEATVTPPHDPMRFALIGAMDLTRLGSTDRTYLGAMIVAAGGTVDYDLPPPGAGNELGQMTPRTGYYVIDDRTPFVLEFKGGAEGAEHAREQQEFLKKQSEAIKQAQRLGIRPMTIERLFTLLENSQEARARSHGDANTAAGASTPWWGKIPRDPTSEAILRKLEEPISMSFANETPLEDVLKYIKSATQGPADTGLPIYVDPVGLNEAEKTMTSPVTLDLEGVPLRITLRLLLKQLGLTYDVKDGLLTITAEGSEDRPIAILEHVRRARRGELSVAEIRELTEAIRALQELDKASQAVFGADRAASGAAPDAAPSRR